jgi:Uma2 family endonuclease
MSVSTLLTEDEFLNLPEIAGKQELLDGELIQLPPARYFHTELSIRLLDFLRTVLGKNRVWMEMAYRLRPGRWLIPDVSVSWPDQPIDDEWFQGSPMLAIEIASRGNTGEELEQKTAAYLEGGAAEVWVIYPKARGMVVSRKDCTLRIASDSDYRCDLIGITLTPADRTPVAPRV